MITEILTNVDLFTADEAVYLQQLQEEFRDNVSHMTPTAYNKEMERLAIDLSWKIIANRRQYLFAARNRTPIEGKETAAGKPRDDATMLLNHKEALNFIIENPDYVMPLFWLTATMLGVSLFIACEKEQLPTEDTIIHL